MSTREIAAALRRVESVMARRPEAGLHDDASASAHWAGGTRVVCGHANGRTVQTDMPAEMGGTGDQVSPGWLLRAGFAACTTTCIAMAAARQGIELAALDVTTDSRSDVRGLLGMPDPDGSDVYAGPVDVRMRIRVAAPGVAATRLRALVDEAYRLSPMTRAVRDAIPVDLHVEIVDEAAPAADVATTAAVTAATDTAVDPA